MGCASLCWHTAAPMTLEVKRQLQVKVISGSEEIRISLDSKQHIFKVFVKRCSKDEFLELQCNNIASRRPELQYRNVNHTSVMSYRGSQIFDIRTYAQTRKPYCNHWATVICLGTFRLLPGPGAPLDSNVETLFGTATIQLRNPSRNRCAHLP